MLSINNEKVIKTTVPPIIAAIRAKAHPGRPRADIVGGCFFGTSITYNVRIQFEHVQCSTVHEGVPVRLSLRCAELFYMLNIPPAPERLYIEHRNS